MTFGRLAAVSILAACLAGACSNTSNKKKPIGNDAATGDGSISGGGAGGAEAGPEAAPDVVDAMPDVTADVASDVTDAMTCGAGTVNLVDGGCVVCPPDAGNPGAGTDSGALDAGADAATGPYSPALACTAMDGAGTQFDPSTNTLTVKVHYPLQLDSADYQLVLTIQTAAGGPSPLTVQSSAPLVNNTLTLQLSGQLATGETISQVSIKSLTAYDACGRASSFVACTSGSAAFLLDPPDGGGAWTAICTTAFC